MSETCTCPWRNEDMGGGYFQAVPDVQPDCPEHGHLAAVDGTVTIWERVDHKSTNLSGQVVHRETWHEGTIRGEKASLSSRYVDGFRREKQLTDAELAAEYFSWLFLASHTAFEDGGWSRVAEECSKRAQVLERFATHDQAVRSGLI